MLDEEANTIQIWNKRTPGWKIRGLGHSEAFSTIPDKHMSALQGSLAPFLVAQLLLLGLYLFFVFVFLFKLSHQATQDLCSSFFILNHICSSLFILTWLFLAHHLNMKIIIANNLIRNCFHQVKGGLCCLGVEKPLCFAWALRTREKERVLESSLSGLCCAQEEGVCASGTDKRWTSEHKGYLFHWWTPQTHLIYSKIEGSLYHIFSRSMTVPFSGHHLFSELKDLKKVMSLYSLLSSFRTQCLQAATAGAQHLH